MADSYTVNPVAYEGGQAVFLDTEYDSWNMDPLALHKAFQLYPDVKLIVMAHLYGTPAKVDQILAIAHQYGALIVEDAAESFGASYNSAQTGSFGHVSVLSFNGNKIVTGSSGGILLTDSKHDADLVRKWSTQSREIAPWYQHDELGFNYRMSNIVAGIVRGQLPYLDEHIQQKKRIYEQYKVSLNDLPISMNPLGSTGALAQRLPEKQNPPGMVKPEDNSGNITAGKTLVQTGQTTEASQNTRSATQASATITAEKTTQTNTAESGLEANYWLSCLIIDPSAMCEISQTEHESHYKKQTGKSCPTEILQALAAFNAEGRPIWKPMHLQPIYRFNPFVTRYGLAGNLSCDGKNHTPDGLCVPLQTSDLNDLAMQPTCFASGNHRHCMDSDQTFMDQNPLHTADYTDVGADIFTRGLCLPSDNKMTPQQQQQIIELLHRCFY